MIKKLISSVLFLVIVAQPSFAIENGEPEKDASRTVVLYFGQEYPGCSGFLYEPKIVFTAAHCLIGPHPVTHVGMPNNPTGLNAKKIAVKEILFHDQYNKQLAYQNDFAILILSQSIPVNNKVVLLTEETQNKIIDLKPLVKVSGYGDQDKTGTSRETIREAHYFYASLTNINPEIELKNIDNKGVCSGDSGGPNTLMHEGVDIYLGATSHGWNQTNCGRWAGGGNKVLLFEPVYKFNNLINQAKNIVGPEIVMQVVKPTPTPVAKKKCIKLKTGKCKK